MLKTRFTELVGCSVPIQQAGMGALANKHLAAAIANAGGQGMLSWSGMSADNLAATLDDLRQQTAGVFGVNFLIPDFEEEPEEIRQCVRVAAARAKVIDFFYHDPVPSLVEVVHQRGALACWQVGSRDEAIAAVEAGCDFIIAQGIEAGGHVRGRIGLLALLNQVLESVGVPVLAAGGIGTGRAMAAALAAGADGVRVGTRFVAADEAGAHPIYVQALLAAAAQDTFYGDVFSANWANAPHRALRSSIEAAQAFEGEIVGERLSLGTGNRVPVTRFESLAVTMDTTGSIEAMPHWAGESVDGVKRVQPAAEIVRELAAEAEQLLKRWC
jgi:nitronate monooxygenase